MLDSLRWIGGSLCGLLLTLPVSAQIIPDTTLGNENTTLTPINPNHYHIDGGAIRDINLFHSFLEFNIQQNQSIYFSNPLGVENILTRVTGNNPSDINGRLGVAGEANLFLLNPNGIIFGENASLDIRGSFLATTADSIQLGDNGFFSATDIANSQLLSVQPGALFHNALNNHQARIENQGNLQVGGNLTLDSPNLTLQGQLHAGGDLILNAQDTVKLRDSSTTPFIASAGGEMLIQGNESVDIFILNHSDSGLYSRGNMTLRSANPVIGDAHYQTGGNFRVETLDGSLNELHSPNDPVVYANGDFSTNLYFGASLHVLAGGSINIPLGIFINGPDTVGNSINPTNTPNLATVTTSDGQTITIDGSTEATVDLRAGVDWAQLGGFPGLNPTLPLLLQPPFATNNPTATSADINTGLIAMPFANPGRVLLTNQYAPNQALNGNITISQIFLGDDGQITVDSRNNINQTNLILANSATGDGNDVTFLAANNINLGNNAEINVSGQRSGSLILNSQGTITLDNALLTSSSSATTPGLPGSNIEITADTINVINSTRINTRTLGRRNAGDVNFNARILNTQRLQVFSNASREGNAGDINLNAQVINIRDDSVFTAETAGRGNAGNINLNAQIIDIDNGLIGPGLSVQPEDFITSTFDEGKAGNINFNADILQIRNTALNSANGSFLNAFINGLGETGQINFNGRVIEISNTSLQTTTFGQPDAGDINITAQNLSFDNSQFLGQTVGQGRASDININTQNLAITNNSILSSNASFATARSQGNAGSLNITATGNTILDNNSSIRSSVEADVTGNGGQVNLTTNSLQVSNNSRISTSTAGRGNAGQLMLNIGSNAVFDNNSFAISEVLQDGVGNGGQVNLSADSLQISNDSRLSTSTFGRGNAGQMNINLRSDAVIRNNSSIASEVKTGAVGNSGRVDFTADTLLVTDNAELTTNTLGRGNAGRLNLDIRSDLVLDNNSLVGSSVARSGIGEGGQLNLAAASLRIANRSRLTTSTLGQGNAGNLDVNVSNLTQIENNGIAASEVASGAVGNGGRVNLTTGSLQMLNNGRISTNTLSQGNAGSLNIIVRDRANLDNSFAASEVTSGAVGNGGQVNFTANSLALTNGAFLSASTRGQGNSGNVIVNVADTAILNGANSGIFSQASADATGNGGQVIVNAGTLQLSNNAGLSSSAEGVGVAGGIAVNTGFLSLDNARILTETRSGDGGNIGLNVDGILVLRHGSLISTTAGSAGVGGNGGNIDIRAEFVIGVPGENSDITANAFEGQGGNILITTNGIYGLQFRDALTPLSDITASSEFGLNGSFTLDLLSFPAEQGINELSGALVDAEALVGRDVCAVENDQIAGGSSFIVTGRGGLPPNPVELMTPGTGAVEWASRSENAVAVVPRTEPLERSQIQQTQGWVVTPDGQIQLTAVAPNAEMGAQGYAYPICDNWE